MSNKYKLENLINSTMGGNWRNKVNVSVSKTSNHTETKLEILLYFGKPG